MTLTPKSGIRVKRNPSKSGKLPKRVARRKAVEQYRPILPPAVPSRLKGLREVVENLFKDSDR